MKSLLFYFARLSRGKIVLWCYLIWYLVTVGHHFDPSPSIWLNSLGISAVIGFALMLSVSGASAKVDSWQTRWQTARLFMMPFGVSSFSALIKGRGFILIFSPVLTELLVAIGACLLFVALVYALKKLVPA